MPEVRYSLLVERSREEVWQIVKDINNWADLIPGFRAVEVLDELSSRWHLKGDVGILEKSVTLVVRVVERCEGSHVTFLLESAEDNVKGTGRVELTDTNGDCTNVTFELLLEAGGLIGPVVNALLSGILPLKAEEFGQALKRRLEGGAQV